MIKLEEAVSRILQTICPTKQETALITNAADRVLATSQESAINLPRFENSK